MAIASSLNCRKCGECCKNLPHSDDIYMTDEGFTMKITNGRCEYLTEDNFCSIHKKKPKMCRDWFCDKVK